MAQNANDLVARATTIQDSGEQRSTVCGSTTKEETALDLAACPFVAFRTSVEQIHETLSANLGEATMGAKDLEPIKMPSGASTAWTVPDIGGEQLVKELSGIILMWRELRKFWKLPMEQSEGAMPPDCYSPDTKTGIGSPGGDCLNCRFAQFGSDPKGEGQACKLFRQLFLLREDNLLPLVVNLSPASIKPVRLYFKRLAAKGLPCYTLVTKIGLEKTRNGQGIEYSRATFSAGVHLPPELAKRAREYGMMLRSFLDATPPVTIATDSQMAEAV